MPTVPERTLRDRSDGAARLVRRTCDAQGVPETITDPAVLYRVAALVVGGADHAIT